MTHDRQGLSAGRSELDAVGRQFSHFVVVGLITTVVHYGVLVALVEAFATSPVAATAAGFLSAVLFSYLLNRRYTFHDRRFGPGLLKYVAAVFIGLLVNIAIVGALTHLGAHYLLAQIFASGVALGWNFVATRFVLLKRDGA
jgi:putative flippase GtrA